MKKRIVLAVVVAAVVLAAAFALHRPQAGTQPTPEPTRQAETNDAVPAEPTPQPAATAEPQPTATTVPQQTTAPKPTQKPATKKTPVLNAAGQPTASAAPAEMVTANRRTTRRNRQKPRPPAQPKPRLWTRKTLNCRLFRQNHRPFGCGLQPYRCKVTVNLLQSAGLP